jgi:hypothetical protein
MDYVKPQGVGNPQTQDDDSPERSSPIEASG